MLTLDNIQALVFFFSYNIALKADIFIYLTMMRKTSKCLVRVKTKMVLLDGPTHDKENQGKCIKQKLIQNASKL